MLVIFYKIDLSIAVTNKGNAIYCRALLFFKFLHSLKKRMSYIYLLPNRAAIQPLFLIDNMSSGTLCQTEVKYMSAPIKKILFGRNLWPNLLCFLGLPYKLT